MYEINIDVTGNIARVTKKPSKITAGSVGLPVEFTFDSQWEGLEKTAVFQAGNCCKIEYRLGTQVVVPWEVLEKPGNMLCIGVYGVNKDGSVAIPTIWANIGPILPSAHPNCEPSTDPSLPVYQKLLIEVGDPAELKTNTKDDIVTAVNEIFDKTEYARAGMVVDDNKPTAKPILWFNTSD